MKIWKSYFIYLIYISIALIFVTFIIKDEFIRLTLLKKYGDHGRSSKIRKYQSSYLNSFIEKYRPKTFLSYIDFGFSQPDPIKTEKKRQRFPKVIVIGAQKCGTTALIKFLSFHTAVSVQMKERHFFTNDSNFVHGSPNYEFYRRGMFYSTFDQITIEKTPNYFAASKVPQRVFEYQKFMKRKLKFIVIVRNPIRRAISAVFHEVRANRLKLDNLTEVLLKPGNNFVNLSMYGYHLNRWLEYFKLKQFLFINGERFINENPCKTMRKIERFLKLPQEFEHDDFGFIKAKPNYYCYLPLEYCFESERGHSNYPQNVTTEALKILTNMFEADLRLFHNASGIKPERLLV